MINRMRKRLSQFASVGVDICILLPSTGDQRMIFQGHLN